MLPIDKGIPIPPLVSESRTGLSETLRKMEVGDSVFLSGREDTKLNIYYSRLPDKQFTARKTLGGVRIWRIA